jgi:Arc/MetJ family transcription regulator
MVEFDVHHVMQFNPMRTHIELDDSLLNQVINLGKFETKKAAVNAALADYVKRLKRARLLKLEGKIAWQGDLDRLRSRR